MLSSFFQNLRRREILGMDVGSSGVKFVRLHRQGRGHPSSLTVSHWFYPGPVLEGGEETISGLRDFLRIHHLGGASVACNLEEASLRIRRVELPCMPEEDLKEAVRWQMRDVVEGPVSDHVVRYSLIEEMVGGDPKRLSLLAYAIRKESVRCLLNFLKKLGLRPILVEPTSVSLLAIFDRVREWKEGEFYGLLDLGESKSLFVILGNGRLYFSRPLVGISGKEFVTQTRGLKEEEALPLYFNQMAVEIQKSIDAFSLMFRKEGIRNLFLCGGGAGLPGLTNYLTKNLAIPTELLKPGHPFLIKEGSSHLYDVALGLAMYGFTN